MLSKMVKFFTNRGSDTEKSPVQAPAFSITKVGVAAMFLWTLLSGLTALIKPLNNANEAVIAGAFDLAQLGLLVAGAIAVADILIRGLPAIFAAGRAGAVGTTLVAPDAPPEQ